LRFSSPPDFGDNGMLAVVARSLARNPAMLHRVIVALCLALLVTGTNAQEVRYITDNLQLGLYTARDGSGEPIRNLVSGTEVTVLERIPNFARVRTPAGEEGWVKSAFLVEEKPARLRVAEFEAGIEVLEQELALAESARATAESGVAAIQARTETELASVRSDRAIAAQLEQDNAGLRASLDTYRGAVPWPWVVGALVVALGAGFYAGYWWLDSSIRRRHGGFRVY
jgi:hypothetical protein